MYIYIHTYIYICLSIYINSYVYLCLHKTHGYTAMLPLCGATSDDMLEGGGMLRHVLYTYKLMDAFSIQDTSHSLSHMYIYIYILYVIY